MSDIPRSGATERTRVSNQSPEYMVKKFKVPRQAGVLSDQSATLVRRSKKYLRERA